ncbi:trypsin, putative [Eimeria necatrix]|uniref:Trypsin, putative n=1 Tax=Eimeria necatrix TaxID=51315 RepID=U6MSS7_9EIME|nr:trypsin, putative [Eimeria necatrix]CDJ67056.1 trypsin, putative [Eimeria necatrix]
MRIILALSLPLTATFVDCYRLATNEVGNGTPASSESAGDGGVSLGFKDAPVRAIQVGLQKANPSTFQEFSFIEEGSPIESKTGSGNEAERRNSTPEGGYLSAKRKNIHAKSSVHLTEVEEFASVVKIFVNTVKADFVSPWQMMAPKEQTGSGFVVEGRMIMTNAHLVADQTRVLVRRHGNPKRFLARVLAVCHECDLALVTVDDDVFWERIKPLAFGGVPQLRETVVVLGYPTGGDQLSITEGVVSRVGVSMYAHSSLGLLTVQIDAPINPGNSGGPALAAGKVVGVAFQGFSEMQNVGYIVPFPVIRHFLNDIALHKQHTGIVSLGIKAQPMENEALKRFKGMDTLPPEALPENVTASGVLVVSVDKVRQSIYTQGKIALPLSRYSQIPESSPTGKRCVRYKAHVSPSTAAFDSSMAKCELMKPILLGDQPVPRENDTTEHQRNVKEIATRVIWQPENWKPSTAASCSHCRHQQLIQSEKRKVLQNQKKASQSDIPEAADVQRETGPMQWVKTIVQVEDAEGVADAGGSRLLSIVETKEQHLRRVSAQGSTSNRGVNEESAPQSGQDARMESPLFRADIGSATQSGQDAKTANPLLRADTAGVQESTSARSEPPTLDLGVLKKAERAGALKYTPTKPSRHGSGDEDDERQKGQGQPDLRTQTGQTPVPEKRQSHTSTIRASLESLLREILRGPSKLRQVRNILRGRGGGDEGDSLRETFSATNAKRKAEQTSNSTDKEQNEDALEKRPVVSELKLAGKNPAGLAESNDSSPNSTNSSSKEVRSEERTATENNAEEKRNLEEKSQKHESHNNERETEDTALAVAAHPLVDNPYFNPAFLDEKEFLGFREGDVILSVGNYSMDLERVSFHYAITQYFNGETTWAYVLRDNRVIKITVPLMTPNFKVPPFTWDMKPSYFVYGGFVFTPLSKVLLATKLRKEAPHMFEFLVQKLDYQEEAGDEFVVLSLILASDISVGYEVPPCIVHSVNGHHVRNMQDLVRFIEAQDGDFVELQLEANEADKLHVAIDRKKAAAIQQKVLKDHNIVSDRSPDLIRRKK